MHKLLYTLLLSACSFTAISQTYKSPVFTDPDRIKKIEATYPVIDRIYKEYAEKNHFPGIVYGIVVDGKLVHTGAAGYANIGSKIVADNSSDFRIASMSKSFTAMAILKLRDEGKLKLDDPVSMYIPEMKNNKYLTSDAVPITIRHLLTHAAGLPQDDPWGDRQLANTDEQLVAVYKNGVSFSNDPGITFEYSNLGFATLGYIIKKVSGKPYEDYITENILKPLGMTHTYYEYDKIPKDKLALGYRWLDNQWVEQPLLHDGAYGAMGGMITTMEDFSKYVALHLSAWPSRDDLETGPVKRSSIREMQFPWNFSGMYPNATLTTGRTCPITTAYCYGLSWSKDCDYRVQVGHSGGLPGFGSNWRILPDYGIGVIAFANLTYANAGYPNKKVLDTLLALSHIEPRQLPASAILNKRKEQLVKLLPNFNGAKESGIFAVNFFMDYFTDKLKAEAKEIFEKAGKITKVRELVAENQLRGYFIMEGEKANVSVSFTLTPEHEPLIQEYEIASIPKQ